MGSMFSPPAQRFSFQRYRTWTFHPNTYLVPLKNNCSKSVVMSGSKKVRCSAAKYQSPAVTWRDNNYLLFPIRPRHVIFTSHYSLIFLAKPIFCCQWAANMALSGLQRPYLWPYLSLHLPLQYVTPQSHLPS